MFKLINTVTLIAGLACTAMFVYTGLTGDGPVPWANGWMAGPIILLTVLPVTGMIGRLADGPLRELRGHVAKGFENTPIAIGTVVSVSRTGLTVNDQPQLEILFDVDTADGQSFRAVSRSLVDLTELAAVVPGAVLPVRYRPGSTDGRVVIAVDAPQAEMQAAFDRVRVAKGLVTPASSTSPNRASTAAPSSSRSPPPARSRATGPSWTSTCASPASTAPPST
nr:hypothetical protein GCM10025732_58210 [Glycomyces mayteni]